MLKFYVAMGCLFFFTFSLLCDAQELEPSGTVPEAIQADSPTGIPEVPAEITIKSSLGNVVLPHDVHVKKVKLKCSVCHHQIRATELDTPHPDYLTPSWSSCQACHNADSKSRKKYYKCSKCHHSDVDNFADETLSSKVVIHKSCWQCHEAGTGAEASKGCSDCHVKEDK